ncbi:MAG: hypothetical protein A2W25_14015 [candidate division Zixibacteria bacterium RBG_16_53_22]|nr:MAG: hypothetical protein A2W25_14015 [candidate division Zixibacteria bacterium RBG_16_53_22]
MNNLYIRFGFALALITALACANPFAPPKAGPGSLAPILPQNCAECPDSVNAYNVLSNFRYAYENRDIDVYENCLDNNFVFIYTDQDRQGGIETVEIPRDGISGDIYRTRGLFEAFNEIRLDVWNLDRSDPDTIIGPDQTVEIRESWQVVFYLSLRDSQGTYNYQQYEANGLAVFKIRQSPDGLWRIVVWEDHSFTD